MGNGKKGYVSGKITVLDDSGGGIFIMAPEPISEKKHIVNMKYANFCTQKYPRLNDGCKFLGIFWFGGPISSQMSHTLIAIGQ